MCGRFKKIWEANTALVFEKEVTCMHCMILWSVERVTEETPCENKYELFQNIQKKLCNTFRNILTPTLNFHNTSTKALMVVVPDHLPHSASPSSDS